MNSTDNMEQAKKGAGESVDFGGMLIWYFIYAALGAPVTLVANLATFNLIDDYSGIWTLAAADIISWVFYAVICIYVVVAFVKRLPNAVAIARVHLITLLVINGYVLLSGGADPSSAISTNTRMITSMVCAVIFLLYFLFSKRVAALIPKETRRMYKADKICIFGTIALYFILLGFGLLDAVGKNPFESKQSRFLKSIAAAQTELPIEIDEGYLCTGIGVEGDNLVYTYKYPDVKVEVFDEPTLAFIALMDKERFLANLTSDKDVAFLEYLSTDLAYVCRSLDADDRILYQFSISQEEYRAAYESTEPYATEFFALSQLLYTYNQMLPMDFMGGTVLDKVRREQDGGGFVFDITIPEMDYEDIRYMTEEYLREFWEESFNELQDDDIVELALMNGCDIVFHFGSEVFSWWEKTIAFTPEECRQLLGLM